MKRDKYDMLFSALVRFRTGDTPVCQKCGIQFPDATMHKDFRKASAFGLECAHIHSRRYTSGGLRWSLDNAVALCSSCHSEAGSQPVNHSAWLESYLGKGFAEILNEKLNSGQRMKQHDKDEMYKHMKGQWEKLYAARMAGEQGYVEITDWI